MMTQGIVDAVRLAARQAVSDGRALFIIMLMQLVDRPEFRRSPRSQTMPERNYEYFR